MTNRGGGGTVRSMLNGRPDAEEASGSAERLDGGGPHGGAPQTDVPLSICWTAGGPTGGVGIQLPKSVSGESLQLPDDDGSGLRCTAN